MRRDSGETFTDIAHKMNSEGFTLLNMQPLTAKACSTYYYRRHSNPIGFNGR